MICPVLPPTLVFGSPLDTAGELVLNRGPWSSPGGPVFLRSVLPTSRGLTWADNRSFVSVGYSSATQRRARSTHLTSVNWFFAWGKLILRSGGSGCEGIVCSYSLELDVVNGLANFPRGHIRQVFGA